MTIYYWKIVKMKWSIFKQIVKSTPFLTNRKTFSNICGKILRFLSDKGVNEVVSHRVFSHIKTALLKRAVFMWPENKPGSVMTAIYLRCRSPAQLKMPPLRRAPGRRFTLLYGVAPDRVYRFSALPQKAVSSCLAFPPLPQNAAVYFCCTFPGVAPGCR